MLFLKHLKYVKVPSMNSGFWAKLEKPIMALAPMADVTDAAFRLIIAKYSKWGGHDIGDGSKASLPAEAFRVGGPDIMFTEFVSADGLCHPKGREKLLIDLLFTESERPIVAQLFTGHPEKMYEAAKLVQKLGFDGLDINMGCPDRKVEKQCAGAALMKNPALAREIIRAAKEGAPNLPVSVKTRLGYNKNELQTWLPELLVEEPVAVTIHARTRKEMSDVPARWERVKRAVEIRDELKSGTLILGNGDVTGLADARAKASETGADGVMFGRAIFGNPWLFAGGEKRSNLTCPSEVGRRRESGKRFDLKEPSVKERLQVMLEHTKLFEELFAGIKNFAVMKKHYKAYVNGFDGLPAALGRAAQAGAKELRLKLMEANNAHEVETLVQNFLSQTSLL